jgi:hypothetical protein
MEFVKNGEINSLCLAESLWVLTLECEECYLMVLGFWFLVVCREL